MAFWDVYERTANVAVQNETGKILAKVAIVHKYSDNYKNDHTWTEVNPGETTAADMVVNYHTGTLTTGRDWWQLTIVDEEGGVYISDPQNFRDVFDFLEKGLGDILPKLEKAFHKAAQNPSSDAKKRAYAAAGEAVAMAVELMLNHAETAGFKQHILRDEDAGHTTTFTIRRLPSEGTDSDALLISSNSGDSETRITRLKKKVS
ncbi:hypothetical protein [Saccharopolyspora shandongensis]|uniref:Up-regulated in Daf-2 domain-containing protein n=1 Tax=Saccharopolyspora shandongensis TaxID=418495 RepID=A0A1H3TMF4_9PSEU|nr:hypothetical protein [Saccharopolyspora shandongensis]SDZ51167.1 hypothetical protein SAMN05216215_108710 [Saccharopolyspora shandongensis]